MNFRTTSFRDKGRKFKLQRLKPLGIRHTNFSTLELFFKSSETVENQKVEKEPEQVEVPKETIFLAN